MTAFVGLVAGVLIIAGAGSIILTHNAARKQATQQLVTEAQSLTAGASRTQRLAALNTVRRVLRLADARFITSERSRGCDIPSSSGTDRRRT